MHQEPSPGAQHMFGMYAAHNRALGREYSPAPRTPYAARFANNFIHSNAEYEAQPDDRWAQLQESIQSLAFSCSQTREAVMAMSGTVQQSAERISMVEGHVSTLQGEMNNLRKEASNQADQATRNGDKLTRLRCEFETHQAVLDTYDEGLSDVRARMVNRKDLEEAKAEIATGKAERQQLKESIGQLKENMGQLTAIVEALQSDVRVPRNTHVPPSQPSTSSPLPDADRARRICVFQVPFEEEAGARSVAYRQLQDDICDIAGIPRTSMTTSPVPLGMPFIKNGKKLHSVKLEAETRFNAYAVCNSSFRIWQQLKVSVSEDLTTEEQELKKARVELFRRLQKEMPEARFR